MAFAIVTHLVNHVVGTFKKHCLIMKNTDELFLTEDFNGENKGKQTVTYGHEDGETGRKAPKKEEIKGSR